MGLKSTRKESDNSQEIQTLLSDKQELTLLVAELQNRIAEQTEKIEKLNDSDLILKDNEKLKEENRNLRSGIREAEAEAERTISRYEKRASELRAKESEIDDLISRKAGEVVKAEKLNITVELNKQYGQKCIDLEESYRRKKEHWKDIASKVLKISILAVFMVCSILVYSYCSNNLRSENKALQERLENAKTSAYVVTEKVQLYDLDKTERNVIFSVNNISTYDVFVVVEEQDDFVKIRLNGDDYLITKKDFDEYAEKKTVDLS